jgi:hypothetical protein
MRPKNDLTIGMLATQPMGGLPAREERRRILLTAQQTVAQAAELARRLDAVFGHDTHFPVAVTSSVDGSVPTATVLVGQAVTARE